MKTAPFKLKSGNKPDIAKMAGVSPAKETRRGSDQEKKVEKGTEYVDSQTSVVSSAAMENLMRNKPDASDTDAMKRWQAAYDKAKAEFIASKKK
tara:strand:- start:284 stop:565 length:282 start_codon:yes stop_codon:yes gene_type:complete